MERGLLPIWNKIIHVGRGRRVATDEEQFADEKTAKDLSTMTLKNKEVILLPTYLGRETAKLKVEEIPAGIDVVWISAAITYDLDEKKNVHFTNAKKKKPDKGS